MITHFARRALAQASTPEVEVDINNLYASAFLSPVAIYVASLASFRLWKALEHYDASPLGLKPMEDQKGKLSKKRKIMLAAIFLSMLGLEGALFYGAFTGSKAIVNGFVIALTFFISWAGFASPVSYVLCDAVVRRIPGIKRAMPVVTPVRNHRRRRLLSSLFCAAAAGATTYTGSSIAWNLALTGFVFRMLAVASPVNRKGWTSVRGMVIGLLSYITLVLVVVAGLLFVAFQNENGNKESKPEDSVDLDMEMYEADAQKMAGFSNSIVTALIGMLIALVYRAEASKSTAAVRLQESSEELQWEMPVKHAHGHGHGHHRRSEQPEAEVTETTSPVTDAPAPEAPVEGCRRFKLFGRKGACRKNGMKRCGRGGRKFLKVPGVILPASSTVPAFSPLTAPIATLALLTYILVHVPALLLTSENATFGFKYLRTAPEVEQDKCMKIMLEVLAFVPPRFWAAILVPVVVGVACVFRWSSGGKEMWAYAEEWILVKSKKIEGETEVEVEAATVPVVAAPAGDEKVAPPAYEVLFEADAKDVPTDVKA